jgi:hypothetical protein
MGGYAIGHLLQNLASICESLLNQTGKQCIMLFQTVAFGHERGLIQQ